ncbi:MAG TPA: hypothetical protein VE326_08085 [Candidatus Binatia bacterium]|nr:hypothetical protein [Candidatus Binatia bacterium]
MKRSVPIVLPLSPTAALPMLAAALLIAALALVAVPAFAGDLCDENDTSNTTFGNGKGSYARDVQEMHEPAPQGTWHIDGGDNGSVQISDWDKEEVLICARVTAWARDKERAERLLRSIHVENSGGRLHAEGPGQTQSARWAVSYRIRAPRSMDLDVQTVNGPVSVEGIRGRMSLHTENGPLELIGAGGDIEGRTTNGPLTVTLTGSRWQGRGLDVETANGPVRLRIPNGYSADLTTGTENGPMAGAYIGASGGRRHHHVNVVLGSGGAPIRVVTTNGPIVVNSGIKGHEGARGHDDADDEDDDE